MTQPGEDLHEHDVPSLDRDRRDLEAPEADAYDQTVPANPAYVNGEPRIPFDADEADVYEQTQIVDLDEDYR